MSSEVETSKSNIMKKFKVVAIGEIVWDMLPAGKQLGGAPLNFAFFAKELGAEAYAVSAIGNDDLGDETFEAAKKQICDTDHGKYRELLVALLSCALMEQASDERKTLAFGDEVTEFDTFEVLFNENDRARFGESVIEGARRVTERRIGAERAAKLRLSAECADIDGGLILRYGDVETNCSLAVMLREMRRELEGKISAILFD
jgi:hypothetical protein